MSEEARRLHGITLNSRLDLDPRFLKTIQTTSVSTIHHANPT